MRRGLFAAAMMTTALAACQTAAPPPPPPPPPPLVEIETPKQELAQPDPYYFNFELPEKDETGAYVTPNSDIGPLETLFHFRSALNVAALSCRAMPGYDLAPKYNSFIKTFAGELRNANIAIERKFARENEGSGARVRDSHMTSLYNHFARPATLGSFCPMAQRDLIAVQDLPKEELQAYAEKSLAEMEMIFQEHFQEIESYQQAFGDILRERAAAGS